MLFWGLRTEQNSVFGDWDTRLYSELRGLRDDVATTAYFQITEDLKGWTVDSFLRAKGSQAWILNLAVSGITKAGIITGIGPLMKRKKECEAGAEM